MWFICKLFQIVLNLLQVFQYIYWKNLLINRPVQFRLTLLRVNCITFSCLQDLTVISSNRAWASQVAQWIKNPPTNAWDAGDVGSIPGLVRSPGRGTGNPLHYSCLENLINRGAWQTEVHGVTKSRTWLSSKGLLMLLISPVYPLHKSYSPLISAPDNR